MMEGKPRALNIPPGRVAQRLQAFQTEHSCPAASSTGALKAPVSTPYEPAPRVPMPRLLRNTPKKTSVQPEAGSDNNAVEAEEQEEVEERGRTLQRESESELDNENEDRVDEVMQDVRSRLYSVQNIVRRERSGSSQARDDMMGELGNMLDNAIATTMTPLPRSPRVLPRSSSWKRPSSPRQAFPPAILTRSQSLKVADPGPNKTHPTELRPPQSPAKTAAKVQEPPASVALPRQFFDQEPGPRRQRQESEPITFTTKRTGFPLSSPVRERALLWESMCRGTISEHETLESSRQIDRFNRISPERRGEERLKAATPLIPLALPQLLDAEKRQQQTRLQELVLTAPREEESGPKAEPESLQEATSSEWPGRLRLGDVGASTPTVQETQSFAQAAEHDDHQRKPRPSVVRTTIKDLLTATRRRVSGKNTQNQALTADKDSSALVRESELRGSITGLENTDAQHLPPLQAHPDEVAQIQSTDGTCMSKHTNSPTSDVSDKDCAATGTNSIEKACSRSSTFSRKFVPPSEQRVRSPIKPAPMTPVRGRTRDTHSPGGRPYVVDQRFALSPARSNSRGSRGSLTFNIKARVSPGRGLGKDDAELFVTANIESDGSDEGS